MKFEVRNFSLPGRWFKTLEWRVKWFEDTINRAYFYAHGKKWIPIQLQFSCHSTSPNLVYFLHQKLLKNVNFCCHLAGMFLAGASYLSSREILSLPDVSYVYYNATLSHLWSGNVLSQCSYFFFQDTIDTMAFFGHVCRYSIDWKAECERFSAYHQPIMKYWFQNYKVRQFFLEFFKASPRK